MKHTLYRHVHRHGNALILRTQGQEGIAEIPLQTLRKVKFPFGSAIIETDTMTYRLDLHNFEPSELVETKSILTDALKARKRDNQPGNPIPL